LSWITSIQQIECSYAYLIQRRTAIFCADQIQKKEGQVGQVGQVGQGEVYPFACAATVGVVRLMAGVPELNQLNVRKQTEQFTIDSKKMEEGE
jgi:hypothetical protein